MESLPISLIFNKIFIHSWYNYTLVCKKWLAFFNKEKIQIIRNSQKQLGYNINVKNINTILYQINNLNTKIHKNYVKELLMIKDNRIYNLILEKFPHLDINNLMQVNFTSFKKYIKNHTYLDLNDIKYATKHFNRYIKYIIKNVKYITYTNKFIFYIFCKEDKELIELVNYDYTRMVDDLILYCIKYNKAFSLKYLLDNYKYNKRYIESNNNYKLLNINTWRILKKYKFKLKFINILHFLEINDIEAIKELIDKVELNLIEYAIIYNSFDIVLYLYDIYKVNNECDELNKVIIFEAIKRNNIKVFKKFIITISVENNLQDLINVIIEFNNLKALKYIHKLNIDLSFNNNHTLKLIIKINKFKLFKYLCKVIKFDLQTINYIYKKIYKFNNIEMIKYVKSKFIF